MTVIASQIAAVLGAAPIVSDQAEQVVSPPLAINLTAIAVGAVAGALYAVRKDFDVSGVVGIAIVAGLGGSLIRDTLLQQGPPLALTEPWYLGTALIAATFGFFFASLLARFHPLFLWLDALALGLFAIVGAQMAIMVELPVVAAILVGLLTAVGGSLLRDLLSGQAAEVLLPGPPYATAAVVGILAYIAMTEVAGIRGVASEWIAVAVVVGVRIVTAWLGWRAPRPVDLTPRSLRSEGEPGPGV